MTDCKSSKLRLALTVAAVLLGGACSGQQSQGSSALTLDTGVDRAALSADVTPVVADIIRSGPSGSFADIGFFSQADADAVQLGRPYSIFELHKGPRLLFQNVWAVPVLVGGEYRSITDVERKGSKYVLIDLGSTELAGILAAREAIAGVSDALDRGRAGLLRVAGEGGTSLIAYEADVPADALQADIRVLPLGSGSRWFQGLDGSVDGVPEARLVEIDGLLPP